MRPIGIGVIANSALQNRINISIVYNYIRECGFSYRAQMVKELNLSAPAVSRAVEFLRRENFLITEDRRTTLGKLTTWYAINPNKGFVIAVDLISDPVRLAVFDYSGRIVKETRGFAFSNVLDLKTELVESIRSLIAPNSRYFNIKAISFGVPAVISHAGAAAGGVLYQLLEETNLKEMIQPIFQIPVFVENTANASALSEARFGKGHKSSSFLFVEISNGLGAGVVQDGNVVRGHQGAAGEIGYQHMTIGGDTLEQTASLSAIQNAALESIRSDPTSLLASMAASSSEPFSPRMVFEAANRACPRSLEILNRAVETLSLSLQQAILLLDPELVIVGGELCNFPGVNRLIVDPLREYVNRQLPFKKPRIELSEIGASSTMIGVATLAIESLLFDQHPYKLQS